MKKIYIILCALAISCTSFAQTITNAGMETWRTSSSGTFPTVTHAPTDWYSFDSLAIAGLEMYGAGLGFTIVDTYMRAQLFQENTIVHGGSSSAKLVSVWQDSVGIFAGSLANAQPGINTAAAIACGCVDASVITYSGGTSTGGQKVVSASAWVEYFPGKDSITGLFGGVDSGTMVVQAIATVLGADSVVGTGSIKIGATSSFTQVTANVVYIDSVDLVNKVRIIFGSGQTTGGLDSSIMYVDDVTMVTAPQAVGNVTMKNDLVKVYPNPTTGIIHLDGPQNTELTCELFSISGQVITKQTFTGNNALDVSYLPTGLYFYNIYGTNGSIVQRGKVTVDR